MDSAFNAVFESLTAEVTDTLPPDRWAVARIITGIVQNDPHRWPVVDGADVREARFGCCRMRYTLSDGAVEIQGLAWTDDH